MDTSDKNTEKGTGENLGACLPPQAAGPPLWTAHGRTSCDMRKIKPYFVSHSRWVFVTVSRTHTLTKTQARTHLSKCLIRETKSETSSPGRLDRVSPLQGTIRSGGRKA